MLVRGSGYLIFLSKICIKYKYAYFFSFKLGAPDFAKSLRMVARTAVMLASQRGRRSGLRQALGGW